MGLEKNLTLVLDEASISRDRYYFEDGFVVEGETEEERRANAEEIMAVIDDSGDFGPTRYRNGKIEIGIYRGFYGIGKDYGRYCQDFKNGLQ